MGTIIADGKEHFNATVALASGNLVVTGKKENGRTERTVYYVTGNLRRLRYACTIRDMLNQVMVESTKPLDIEKFLDVIGENGDYRVLQP